MPSRRTAIWSPAPPPERRFCCPERRVVPGVVRMTRLNMPQRVGWAKSPAEAGDITHRLRATLPTRSSGEAGRRGQRRTTVRANAPLDAMRLCPPYVAAAAVASTFVAIATAAFAQAPAAPTDAEILALMKAHCA